MDAGGPNLVSRFVVREFPEDFPLPKRRGSMSEVRLSELAQQAKVWQRTHSDERDEIRYISVIFLTKRRN